MKLLKKYFIPHKENDYKPHLLRGVGLFGLFSLIILIFAFVSFGTVIIKKTDLTALVLPKVLVDYVNQDRIPLNLKTLAINPILQKAAQMKANDMASRGYFAHKSPDGLSPWYWFEKAGYDFSYAGENLAVNFIDSVDVNQAWMTSPSHRENIINGNFTEIGIATAEGTYKGRSTVFVVQLFGRPALVETTSILPVASSPKSFTTSQITDKNKISSTLITTESKSVLGASGENDLYIAVEKESALQSNVALSNYSNFLEKTFSSPRKILNIAYLILSLVILVGLTLAVVIEVKKQHPLYIVLALALIALMFALLYIFQSFLFAPLLIV